MDNNKTAQQRYEEATGGVVFIQSDLREEVPTWVKVSTVLVLLHMGLTVLAYGLKVYGFQF